MYNVSIIYNVPKISKILRRDNGKKDKNKKIYTMCIIIDPRQFLFLFQKNMIYFVHSVDSNFIQVSTIYNQNFQDSEAR